MKRKTNSRSNHAPKGHWGRELKGVFNKADRKHEDRESWKSERREHGLTLKEGEHALLNAQKKKYAGKPKSRFHIGAKSKPTPKKKRGGNYISKVMRALSGN